MAEVITNSFIDAMIELSEKEIPEAVVNEAKYSLVDYIACTAIGSFSLKKEQERYLSSFYDYKGIVPIIGAKKAANPYVASMLNGISAHYVELDDGQRYAMLHLGAPIFSAMLTVAYERKLRFNDFIKGVVIGYEATIRLASAIQPGHKLKGYHATGTCGTIGTAMGIAAALGYNREQWLTTVSAAATDAAGILQVIDDGSELKPYNVGRATVSAINAGYMGITGLKGPSDVLGGGRGFFAVTADRVESEYLLQGFMPSYGIETIYRKPYAACRHCHAAIEAALNIRKEHLAEAGQGLPQSISVHTYGVAVKGHEHTEVQNASHAKMSMPYSVAAALMYGSVNVQQYEDDCLRDKDLNELMGRVSVEEDAEISQLVPRKRAAIVKVTMADGSIYENRVDYPLGEPENKMSEIQLNEKYYSLMSAAGVTKEISGELLNTVYHLESQYDKFLKVLKTF